jgi:uncharacterized protein YcbK (DUF882 family)
VTDWSRYPNFSAAEFACRHTGDCRMRVEFMDALQRVRDLYGAPMIITSGYRHRSHPVEARKATPGEHTLGMAADVAVSGADAVLLLHIALDMGFERIGVQQHGAARFLHLGLGGPGLPSPMIWSY